MSGFEFLAVTKCYARFRSIPVMVITGRPAHAAKITRDGTVCLLKPFDVDQLLKIVNLVARPN